MNATKEAIATHWDSHQSLRPVQLERSVQKEQTAKLTARLTTITALLKQVSNSSVLMARNEQILLLPALTVNKATSARTHRK